MPHPLPITCHRLSQTGIQALVAPLALLIAEPLGAQSPVTPGGSVAAAPAAETVAAAQKILRDRYVLPETGARLDAALAAAQQTGGFAGLKGDALALRINAVLRSVTADGHLSIAYDPQRAAARAVPRPAADPRRPEDFVRETVLANGGVGRLEVLPGNIRYLDYRGFYWHTPQAEAALANAMEFLRDGDAIIIDIRRNGGGSPGAVAALAGYFLPAGTPLVRFEMRGRPGEASTVTAAPFSLAGKPVYVLAGKGSFSAAEEFAAHVSAFGFAKLVGTATGGGAFRNEIVPLPGGFLLSVSVGRPVHARTGKDWEGTGVAPTIATTDAAAFDVAVADATQALLTRAPVGERAGLERLAAFQQARLGGMRPARPIEAYAGRFGDRTFTVADGKLVMERPGRLPVALQSLGGDRFATSSNPAQQWRFEGAGSSIAAVMVDDGRGDGLRLERAAG